MAEIRIDTHQDFLDNEIRNAAIGIYTSDTLVGISTATGKIVTHDYPDPARLAWFNGEEWRYIDDRIPVSNPLTAGRLLQSTADGWNITDIGIATSGHLDLNVLGTPADHWRLIQHVATPTIEHEAANKKYVDDSLAGVADIHQAAKLKSLANITGFQTAAPQFTFVLANEGTYFDVGEEYHLLDGDRVLLTNQVNQIENGIYTATLGVGATVYTLTRSSDANATNELKNGSSIFISYGVEWGGTEWAIAGCVNVITINSDAIKWYQTGASREYIAGSGLSLVGNRFNVGTGDTQAIAVFADTINLYDRFGGASYTGVTKVNVNQYGLVTGISEILAANGIVLRTAANVYSALNGTAYYLPKWDAAGTTLIDSSIYNNNGKVGIGTNAPNNLLDVAGNIGFGANLLKTTNLAIKESTGYGSDPTIQIKNSADNAFRGIVAAEGHFVNGGLVFWNTSSTQSFSFNRTAANAGIAWQVNSKNAADAQTARITLSGGTATANFNILNSQVGIGTSIPSTLLHVAGTLTADAATLGTPLLLTSGGLGIGTVPLGSVLVTGTATAIGTTSSTAGTTILKNVAGVISWDTVSSVSGVSGTGTLGYIAKWTSGSAIGNSNIFDNGTNVGIGTTSPGAKLDIFDSTGSDSASSRFTIRGVQGAGNPGFIFERSDASRFINMWTGSEGSVLAFANTATRLAIGTNTWANRDSAGYPTTEIMSLLPTGNVGIGTTAPTSLLTVNATAGSVGSYKYGVEVSNNPTTATARTIGALTFAYAYDTGLPSDYMAGLEGRAISYATTGNTVPTAYGLKFSVENRASGSLTNGVGIYAAVSNYSAGTGTITNGKGIEISVNKTTGTITNGYGLYINAIVATNSYGIYQVGANDYNYFAGNVGIGTTTPLARLEVKSGLSATYPTASTLNSVSSGSALGLTGDNGLYGLYMGVNSDGNTWMQSQRNAGSSSSYNIILQPGGGNVGIGTTSPTDKLTVNGSVSFLNGRATMRNFSGRNKTFLLYSYPKSYTSFADSESFDFDIYDSHEYDNYSAMNVIIGRIGNGLVKEWGMSVSSYRVRIKTYDDGTNINVYAVTDTYVDYFTINTKYNRDFNTLLGTNVGDNTYVPAGSLVFDSSASTSKWIEGTPSNPLTLTMVGGLIGIGTTTPDRKLSVVTTGDTFAASFQGAGAAGTRVMIGNYSGNAAIDGTNAAGTAGALLALNSSGQPVYIGGNVGIGVTNPANKLTQKSTSDLESAYLQSELLAAGDTWTLGANWTGTFATGFTHTAGSAETVTDTTLVPTLGYLYQVAFTVTNYTAGSFSLTFGSEASNRTWTGSAGWGVKATGTGTLIITPSSTFAGTITISIKRITGSYSATYAIQDSAGVNTLEIRSNLAAYYNSFIGKQAGAYNTTGTNNSAMGVQALYSNTTGYNNSAMGMQALYSNTTGYYNSAMGREALYYNTTGSNNSAMGVQALYSNTTGYQNSAMGQEAGRYIADGVTGRTTGNNGLYLGCFTRASAIGTDNEIVIGAGATGLGSNSVILGNTSITKTVLMGNVGIGTTSPATTLHVAGSVTIDNLNGILKASSGLVSAGTVSLTSEISGILPIANGGTNASSKTAAFDNLSPLSTLGDTVYHDGTNNVRLAGNTASSRKVLTQTGTSTISAAPGWNTLNTAEITEQTNLYYTDARARNAISSTITAIGYSTTTGVLSLNSGYVIPTTAQESTWNAKENALTFTTPLTRNTNTIGLAGLTTYGTANYLVGVNTAGTAWEYKSITGTTNRVSVSLAAGSITLSAPQDIHTGASPVFAGLTLTGFSGILKATAGLISGSAGIDDLSDVTITPASTGQLLGYSTVSGQWTNITRTINTSGPLTGGGALTSDLTLGITGAGTSASGYLSSTDWNTFNNKVGTSVTINTTLPLNGGGDLSTNRTLSLGGLSGIGTASYVVGVNTAGTNWEYKNLTGTTNQVTVSHSANSITLSTPQAIGTGNTVTFAGLTLTGLSGVLKASTGVVSGSAGINDLSNVNAGTATTGQLLGYDTTTSKWINVTRTVNTSAPLSGGGALTGDLTLTIAAAGTATSGYLTSIDWNTFNNKVSTSRSISTTSPLTGGGDLSNNLTLGVGGLTSVGTANYVIGVNTAGTAWEYKSIAGTANQVNVSSAAGVITLSTPQSIGSTASPTFSGITLTALGAGLVKSNSSGSLTNISTGSTGTILRSTGPEPAWTTLTMPDTVAAGSVLVANSANSLTSLTSTSSTTILQNNAGTISWGSLSSISGVTGAGNTNQLAKWQTTSALTTSLIYDNGSTIGIGTTVGVRLVDIYTSGSQPLALVSTGASGPLLTFDISGVQKAFIGMDGGSLTSGASQQDFTIRNDGTTGNIRFNIGSATKAIILNNGNVGIGTTNPTVALELGSTTAGQNEIINATEGAEMVPALEAANWTATNGWSAGSGQLVKVAGGTMGTITPSGTFTVTAGRIYKVVLVISAASGNLYDQIGGAPGRESLAAGTHTQYITASAAAKLVFIGGATVTGTITSVSVKELTPGTGGLTVNGRLILKGGIYSANSNLAIDINSELGTVGLAGAKASAAGYGLNVTGNILTDSNIYATGFSYQSTSYLYLSEATNTASVRNAANQQTFRVYNTYTNSTNYERLAITGVAGTSLNLTAETLGTGGDNLNIVLTPAGTGYTLLNGNVGIGTTVPASLLHVNGTLTLGTLTGYLYANSGTVSATTTWSGTAPTPAAHNLLIAATHGDTVDTSVTRGALIVGNATPKWTSLGIGTTAGYVLKTSGTDPYWAASDNNHHSLAGLSDDDHTQYALLAGRAGGQVLYGGTAAADRLVLNGSTAGTGVVYINSGNAGIVMAGSGANPNIAKLLVVSDGKKALQIEASYIVDPGETIVNDYVSFMNYHSVLNSGTITATVYTNFNSLDIAGPGSYASVVNSTADTNLSGGAAKGVNSITQYLSHLSGDPASDTGTITSAYHFKADEATGTLAITTQYGLYISALAKATTNWAIYTAGSTPSYFGGTVTLGTLSGHLYATAGGVGVTTVWGGSAPVPAAHNVLDSATHSDTLTTTVVRGSIIVGNSTPKWTSLGIGTTAGYVLKTSGTDPYWAVLAKADVGLGSVENTALSTWPGTSNITIVGVVTSGTWNASVVGISYGGTGATTKTLGFKALSPLTTLGDMLYYDGTNNVRLAGNTTTTKKVLTQTGAGLLESAAPVWGTLTYTDVGAAASGHTHSGTYEPVIGAGTTSQYWRGDKSWQTLNTAAVPEQTNLYYTDTRARAAISSTVTALTYTNSTGVLSLTSGYVIPTTTQESTWNAKESALTFTTPLTRSVNTVGIGSLTTIGTANYLVGINTAGTAWEYKSLTGTTNRVTVSLTAGSVTLSGPQDIHTSASPTFAGLTLTGVNGLLKAAAGVVSANTGTSNNVAKWSTDGYSLITSTIYDDGTSVLIGTSSPSTYRLYVNGTAFFNGAITASGLTLTGLTGVLSANASSAVSVSTGTGGYLPKWTSTGYAFENSHIREDANGFIGLNANPITDSRVVIYHSISAGPASAENYALHVGTLHSYSTAGFSAPVINTNLRHAVVNTGNNTGTITALNATTVSMGEGGVIAQAIAVKAAIIVDNSHTATTITNYLSEILGDFAGANGEVTTAYHFKVSDAIQQISIGTQYGLYIPALSKATTNWAIYTAGATPSYFGGAVTVAGALSAASLTTGSSSGVARLSTGSLTTGTVALGSEVSGTLPVTNGGTGLTTIAAGSILAANTASVLSAITSASGTKVLKNVDGAISWDTVSGISGVTGTGTTGKIPKWSSASALTDSIITESSSSIGISSTAPQAKLDIAGSLLVGTNRRFSCDGSTGQVNIRGDAGGYALSYGFLNNSGTSLGGFGALGGADALTYYYVGEYGAEKLVINSAGDVGLGINPINYGHGGTNKHLQVYNAGTSQNSQSHLWLISGNTTGNSAIGTITWALQNSTASSKGVGLICGVSGAGSTAGTPSMYMSFYTRSTTDAYWVERMRITESGGLGIGTADTGAYKLYVNGDAYFSNAVTIPVLNAAKLKTYAGGALTAGNWYRILYQGPLTYGYVPGANVGTRASAKITLYDTASSLHSTTSFWVSYHYSLQPTIILSGRSVYGGAGVFSKIRIITGATYDGCAVEVYCANSCPANEGYYTIENNDQIYGFTTALFTAGSIPASFTSRELDFSTANPIYAATTEAASNAIFIDRSGIISAPRVSLTAGGAIAGTASGPVIYSQDGSLAGRFYNSSNYLNGALIVRSDDDNTNNMVVENGGNVGIATSTPVNKLTVYGAITMASAYDGGALLPYSLRLDQGTGNDQRILTVGTASTAGTLKISQSTSASTLYKDVITINSSGYVGINTSNPQSLTHIYGGASGQAAPNSDARLVIESAGGNVLNMLSPNANYSAIYFGGPVATSRGGIVYLNSAYSGSVAADTLMFRTTGTEKMYLTSTGNLGLGVTNPTARLEIDGNAQSAPKLSVRASTVPGIEFGHANQGGYYSTLGGTYTSGYPYLAFNSEADATGNTFKTRGIVGRVIYADLAGGVKFARATNSSAAGQTLTDDVIINSVGNVGVGVVSPRAPLEIKPSTNIAQIILAQNNDISQYSTLFRDSSTGNLNIGNNSVSASVSITNTGNVGIGTTNPTSSLEIYKNSAGGYGGIITLTNAASADLDKARIAFKSGIVDRAYIDFLVDTSTPTVGGNIIFSNGYPTISEKMRINSGGNVGIGTSIPIGHASARRALILSDTTNDALFEIWGTGGQKSIIQTAGGNTYMGVLAGSGNLNLTYGPNGVAGLIIQNTSGNVGINTTDLTTYRLNVNGNTNITGTLNVSSTFTVGSGTGIPRVSAGAVTVDHTAAESIKAGFNASGGGTMTWSGGNFYWDSRIIVISNGNNASFASDGYFNITCPTSGTITGIGGHADVTCTASGIPFVTWDALYYILPLGGGPTSLPANFRIASYIGALEVPHNWLLIAQGNSDSSSMKLFNGKMLQAGWSVGPLGLAASDMQLKGTANADYLTLLHANQNTWRTRITTDNDSSYIIGNDIGGIFASKTLTLTQANYVGIGTATPVAPLHAIYPNAKTDTTLRNGISIFSNDAANPSNVSILMIGAAAQANRTAVIQTSEYGVVNSGNISLQAYGGNVGIGLTNPASLLTVGALPTSNYNYGTVASFYTAADTDDVLHIARGGVTNPMAMNLGINDALGYAEIQALKDGVSYSYPLILQRQSGAVGIGTTSPDAKLDVAGSTVWSNSTYQHYQNLALYSYGLGAETGTKVITLPRAWTSTMMAITIQGYDYSSYGAWEVVVSGYNYSGSGWINDTMSAEIRGRAPFTSVRLGYNTSSSKIVLMLGTVSTVWQYPKLCVSDFYAGYSNITGWGTGWSITNTTTEAGIGTSYTLNVPIPMQLDSSNNVILAGHIKRKAVATGYLQGQYPTIETTATSGAIYTIGGIYLPGTTTLGNMYGIGYGYSNSSGAITFSGLTDNKWGMYVASGGQARVFLDSDSGNIYLTGSLIGSAKSLYTTRLNWVANGVASAVVGQLGWKNYGENHTIFDASAGTSPDGTAISNTDPTAAEWSATFPTLMGWNGAGTYGVRVSRAKNSDSCLGTAAVATTVTLANSTATTTYLGFSTAATGNTGLYTNAGLTFNASAIQLGLGTAAVSGNSAHLTSGRVYADPTAASNYGNIYVFSNDSQAIDKGGVISFGGGYNGTTDTRFAAIKGAKENSTDAQYGGYMAFYTRTHGASPAERVRIDSAGKLLVGMPLGDAPLSVMSATSNDQALVQQWAYTAGSYQSYTLKLKQVVTEAVVRWAFDQINAGVAYSNILTFDRGKVGIGITNPTTLLSVNGNMRIDNTQTACQEGLVINCPTDSPAVTYGGISFHRAARAAVADGSTIKWMAYYSYAPELGTGGGGMAFSEANTSTRLYLKDGGYVGIGTCIPTSKLHLAAASSSASLTARAYTHLSLDDTSAGTCLAFTVDAGAPYVASIQHRHYAVDNNAYPLTLNPLGGKVGVGTGAPCQTLQIGGNWSGTHNSGTTVLVNYSGVQDVAPIVNISQATSTNTTEYIKAIGLNIHNDDITTTGTRVPALAFSRRANATYTDVLGAIDAIDTAAGPDVNWRAGALTFHTANTATNGITEKMRITAAGNIGLGITTAYARLTVKQSDNGYTGGLHLRRSDTHDTWTVVAGGTNSLYFGYATAASGADAHADFTEKLSLTTDGKLTVAGAVSASGTGGFISTNYQAGVRNPIWRFGGLADAYGLSYFQGAASIDGTYDTLGIHFGTATAVGSQFQFNSNAAGTGTFTIRGSIGIGLTNPSTNADIQGNLFVGSGTFANASGWDRVIDLCGVGHARLTVRTSTYELSSVVHSGWGGAPAGGVTGMQSNHAISFMTNGASRMTISATGKVGIGTSLPISPLSLGGSTSNVTQRMAVFETVDGKYFYGLGIARPDAGDVNSAGLGLWSNTDDALPSDTNMKMFVHRLGNVGIGTAFPTAAKLHIYGTTSTNALKFDTIATATGTKTLKGYITVGLIGSGNSALTDGTYYMPLYQ